MLCSSLLSLFFVKAAHIVGQVRENTLLLLINRLCLQYLRILRFCSCSVAQTLFHERLILLHRTYLNPVTLQLQYCMAHGFSYI